MPKESENLKLKLYNAVTDAKELAVNWFNNIFDYSNSNWVKIDDAYKEITDKIADVAPAGYTISKSIHATYEYGINTYDNSGFKMLTPIHIGTLKNTSDNDYINILITATTSGKQYTKNFKMDTTYELRILDLSQDDSESLNTTYRLFANYTSSGAYADDDSETDILDQTDVFIVPKTGGDGTSSGDIYVATPILGWVREIANNKINFDINAIVTTSDKNKFEFTMSIEGERDDGSPRKYIHPYKYATIVTDTYYGTSSNPGLLSPDSDYFSVDDDGTFRTLPATESILGGVTVMPHGIGGLDVDDSGQITVSPATTTHIGGVIIGDGVSVKDNGTISIPAATTTTRGTVSIGNGINITSDGVISIDTVEVNTDKTLTESNVPADAKVVGDELANRYTKDEAAQRISINPITIPSTGWSQDENDSYPNYIDIAASGILSTDCIALVIAPSSNAAAKKCYFAATESFADKIRIRARNIPTEDLSAFYYVIQQDIWMAFGQAPIGGAILPPATQTELGGIKVGGGLSSTSDGTLSIKAGNGLNILEDGTVSITSVGGYTIRAQETDPGEGSQLDTNTILLIYK